MSTTEVLRTQLDTLRIKNQKLEVDNARLREEHPQEAVRMDAEKETHHWQAEAARYQAESESHAAEAARLRQLYEQLLRDVQASQEEQARVLQRQGELEDTQQQKDERISELTGELERQSEHGHELGRDCANLSAELQRATERTELESHRAAAEERRKWEAREERSVRQLWELQKRLEEVQAQTCAEQDAEDGTRSDGERSLSRDGGAGDRESTARAGQSADSLHSVELPQPSLGESKIREDREVAGSRCESPVRTGNAPAQPRPSQRDSTSAVAVMTAAPPPSQRDSTSAVAGVTAT